MANQEHLDILKQGVEVWNKWREEHATIRPDLTEANFTRANFIGVDLNGANLIGADLTDANLTGANLIGANLIGANLTEANLSDTDLGDANLSKANLIGANLSVTNFSDANLSRADLSRADLTEANLIGADLTGANLHETNLSKVDIGWTLFTDVDLSVVKGLETVEHMLPSSIGIDTIYRSHGTIPEVFLRKAGVQETFLANMRALVDSMRPIDFYSCFISYSSKDRDFAERLYADLQAKGVRCWLDKEDLKIGEKFRPRIDEAIRRHDKLLLVLSGHSVKSVWVEKEVETAFERERRYKKLVLFPIKLDEAVIRTKQAWAADIRRQRHIGDFTCWKDHDAYQKAFNRLLRDLKAESV